MTVWPARSLVLSTQQSTAVKFSHAHFLAPLRSFMLSPANVFAPKVSDTQSDAGNDYPEQDIIDTHRDSSL